MTDRDTHDGDWIAAWIAGQRALLTQASEARAGEAEAAEIGRRWIDAGQTFLDGLRQLAGAGAPGASPGVNPFDIGQTMSAVWTQATMLQASIAEQASEFLRRLPPIGLAREQTEAWRELAAAHAECKRLENELRAALGKVQLDALDLLERRVRERDTPIANVRELYALWVECGERVYGELAHSEAYSKLQAELGNATMRLRTRVQRVLEHALKQLDLPTRSELNSLHRQVRELKLELERLQQRPQAKGSRTAVRKQTAKRESARRKSKVRAR